MYHTLKPSNNYKQHTSTSATSTRTAVSPRWLLLPVWLGISARPALMLFPLFGTLLLRRHQWRPPLLAPYCACRVFGATLMGSAVPLARCTGSAVRPITAMLGVLGLLLLTAQPLASPRSAARPGQPPVRCQAPTFALAASSYLGLCTSND